MSEEFSWKNLVDETQENTQAHANPWAEESHTNTQASTYTTPASKPLIDHLKPEQVRKRRLAKTVTFALVGGLIVGMAERLIEEAFKISE